MSKIDWRSMFKGVLSRMRDAGESNEMGARWMATAADAAVYDLTAERDRLREENERLRERGQTFANQVRHILYRLPGQEFASTVARLSSFDAALSPIEESK